MTEIAEVNRHYDEARDSGKLTGDANHAARQKEISAIKAAHPEPKRYGVGEPSNAKALGQDFTAADGISATFSAIEGPPPPLPQAIAEQLSGAITLFGFSCICVQ